jgi:two-component system chemotaxis response regulator CheB
MKYEAVVIGCSFGGINALATILPALAKDLPVSIMVVQHMSPEHDSFLAEYFNRISPIMVKEAEDKEKIETGTVYLAPPDYHLMVEEDRTLSLSFEEKVNNSRPSIDVLFETAADAFGAHLVGVILTGANHDGSLGLKAIKEKGGLVLAQNPRTADAKVMPEAAIKVMDIDHIMELAEIAPLLNRIVGGDDG